MRSGMFLVAVLAGVLLGGGVVVASGLVSGMATLQPSASAVQNSVATVTETASTTTTAFAASSAPPQTAPPAQSATTSNTTVAAAAGGQLAFMSALQSSTAHPPVSSVSRIADQPVRSLLLLLPIAFAVLLGVALSRVSRS
jgi:hypothetical protein